MTAHQNILSTESKLLNQMFLFRNDFCALAVDFILKCYTIWCKTTQVAHTRKLVQMVPHYKKKIIIKHMSVNARHITWILPFTQDI